MTIHKLIPETPLEAARPFETGVDLQMREWAIAQAIVKTRALRSFSVGAAFYPIHRDVSCAVRGRLEALFDDLALEMNMSAQRLDVGNLLLDGSGVFVHAWGAQKSGYCSCTAEIWADSKARADETRALLLKTVGDRRIVAPMISSTRLCKGDAPRERATLEALLPAGTRYCSVASVYKACARV